MSLPSSGAISMSDMDAEIGVSNTATISLGSNNVRMLGGQSNGSSGAISANSFYGKTYQDGSTSARAAPSALFIKQLTGTTTNGLYWIKPGTNPTPLQVYCDMNIDGGGYMMICCSHPSSGPSSGWGWLGGAVSTVGTYTTAYQLGWGTLFHPYGATFSEWIYGNRANINNYSWGPFVYKYSGINYTNLLTSDSQQSYTRSTIQYNLSVYGSSSPPGMQGAVGYPTSGTNNNFYYMRDCCGFAGYGAYPTYMNTVYCGNDSVVYYSGPFCGGNSQDGSGNFLNGTTTTSGGNVYGGTNQYMMMVR